MNQSLRAIIDNALDDEQYDTTAYNTAEHYDTVFDTDVEKLASALEFLGGNLNNIGTPQEKLLDLYEFSKLAADPNTAPGGATGANPGANPGGAPGGATGANTGANPNANPGQTGTGTGPKIVRRQNRATAVRNAAANAGSTNAAGPQKVNFRPRVAPNSVGAMQGLGNTWNSGLSGKAGIIGGAGALIGAGALLNSALSKEGAYDPTEFSSDYDIYKFAGRGRASKSSKRRAAQRALGQEQAAAAATPQSQPVAAATPQSQPAASKPMSRAARRHLARPFRAYNRALDVRAARANDRIANPGAGQVQFEGVRDRTVPMKANLRRHKSLRGRTLGARLERYYGPSSGGALLNRSLPSDARSLMQIDVVERLGRHPDVRIPSKARQIAKEVAGEGAQTTALATTPTQSREIAKVVAGREAPTPTPAQSREIAKVVAGREAPTPTPAQSREIVRRSGAGAGGVPPRGGRVPLIGVPPGAGGVPPGAGGVPPGAGGVPPGAGGVPPVRGGGGGGVPSVRGGGGGGVPPVRGGGGGAVGGSSNFGRNALIGAGILGLGAGIYRLRRRKKRGAS